MMLCIIYMIVLVHVVHCALCEALWAHTVVDGALYIKYSLLFSLFYRRKVLSKRSMKAGRSNVSMSVSSMRSLWTIPSRKLTSSFADRCPIWPPSSSGCQSTGCAEEEAASTAVCVIISRGGGGGGGRARNQARLLIPWSLEDLIVISRWQVMFDCVHTSDGFSQKHSRHVHIYAHIPINPCTYIHTYMHDCICMLTRTHSLIRTHTEFHVLHL